MPDQREREAVEELRRLEPIFHRSPLGTSRPIFEGMTSHAFWEVGASGNVYDREFVLETLDARRNNETGDNWEVSGFVARHLDGQTWLVTYELDHDGLRSRRSTIWRHTSQGWIAEYHQGTTIAPAG